MTGKKCEVCGREIENPTNRQRFCKECAKKRQAEAFHRYYLANREYYAERSKEQSARRKQSRLEELLAGEPRPFKPPKYTIEQVNNRAIALGISYGWCSYPLSVGKVCME